MIEIYITVELADNIIEENREYKTRIDQNESKFGWFLSEL